MFDVSTEVLFDVVKVRINGCLHLHFIKSRYVGLQTWMAERDGKFCFEITMDGGAIVCEYDTAEKMKSILQKLEPLLG